MAARSRYENAKFIINDIIAPLNPRLATHPTGYVTDSELGLFGVRTVMTLNLDNGRLGDNRRPFFKPYPIGRIHQILDGT